MAKINGILESAIYVDDLERARAFYGGLIGLRSMHDDQRIQAKQGGHHWPPRADDGPPLDDTDRNTDKVIKPSRRKP